MEDLLERLQITLELTLPDFNVLDTCFSGKQSLPV